MEEQSAATPREEQATASPRGRRLTSRLLSRIMTDRGCGKDDDDVLNGRRSWRTPRAGKPPSMFRPGSMTPRELPAAVLPPTLIAPPDENECFVKHAIETGKDGIDSKRLFQALVAIENLQM